MFTTRPEIAGTFGVVASTHWLASQVGMAVLERGGNAFDAAAAAGFTLQVAEPHLNGPGGDAPIILHSARTGTQHVVCGQGPAPAAATLDAFAAMGVDLIPATGLLPAVVPGAFDAWCLMLRDWGTWEFAEVLHYALGYARNGVPVVPGISATIESVRPLFEAEWRSSAAVFLPDGRTPAPGSLFARPALAQTWMRLVREAAGRSREARIDAARAAWYRGFVAEAVDRFSRESVALDVTGERHSGLLRADDLAGWSATVEEPARYDYRGHTVLKCGPWSQGPVFLQQLALLDGFDLDAMDPVGADFVHTVVECAKLAYADREAFGAIIDAIVAVTIEYLSGQIRDGAEAVQLFDSWAGSLAPAEFERWVIEPNAAIVAGLKKLHPDVPVIGFPKGAGAKLIAYAHEVGAAAIGLDETIDPLWAARELPAGLPVQGNLDPLLLVAGGAEMRRAALHVLDTQGDAPFIFNLGHGIVPQTPPDHVAELVEIVRGWKL
jgi:gamma-glutamyltranspeptidase